VTSKIVAIAGANALMLVFGAGLLPLLRLARRAASSSQAALAYAVGLAATGILAADLAVVDVPVGWVLLGVFAVVAAVLGLRRLPGGRPLLRPLGRRRLDLPAYAVLGVTAAFAVPLARLLAVNPLNAIDGWVIWGARAALYDFGHPVAPIFTDPAYQALQHPLLLPRSRRSTSRHGRLSTDGRPPPAARLRDRLRRRRLGAPATRVPPLLLAAVLLAR